MGDETLIYQLQYDLQELFDNHEEYNNVIVKTSYEELPYVEYPMVIISEIENSAVTQFYDGDEHIIDVTYQIFIYSDQSENYTAVENVYNIMGIIRDYMRGERYHALKRLGNTPITIRQEDDNIRIGYMRYVGCIDIDTHTIYRRN